MGASGQISISDLSFLQSVDQAGTITLDQSYDGYFDLYGDQQTKAFPFKFENVSDSGSTILISCSQPQPVDVMVTVKDDSGVIVNAAVKYDAYGSQRVELTDGVTSETPLIGKSKAKSDQQLASFGKASNTGISVSYSQSGGLALVDVQLRGSNGNVVHRTIATKTRDPPPAIQAMSLVTSEVDSNGDVVLKFQSVNKNQPLKVNARIGIVNDAGTSQECVDVNAIVEDHKLVVHNEWFRRCLQNSGFTAQASGWDVVVMNATVTDPEDGYRLLAQMGNVASTGIRNSDLIHRRKLAAAPTTSEITTEMLQGRKPEVHGRQLQGVDLKLLVHGYCAPSNPFPTSDFTNYIPFTDLLLTSVSNDAFARGIYSFAVNNNVAGCECIAHSQGGAACTHLYTYYYSCLDYSSVPGKMIQSLGTPYQGTPIAGVLAEIGSIFGAGCGANYDLSTDGAPIWLSGIPSWSRSQVYYYTTSFPDQFFAYCSLATEPFLDDPNDGVTEEWRDQLSGGNNMGHTTGECHTTGLNYPAQYLDNSRNYVMDAAAQY